ncbi:unnamed protein product [Blepharisma stoltei]|uniref:TPX2 central domain-containing protein n=1 Tax=Blepharisma stoltei TaxID=1481888 RepID=A0AAU9JLX6_9CILI|nr:unnamed protein product [Blepharisma stoltei]
MISEVSGHYEFSIDNTSNERIYALDDNFYQNTYSSTENLPYFSPIEHRVSGLAANPSFHTFYRRSKDRLLRKPKNSKSPPTDISLVNLAPLKDETQLSPSSELIPKAKSYFSPQAEKTKKILYKTQIPLPVIRTPKSMKKSSYRRNCFFGREFLERKMKGSLSPQPPTSAGFMPSPKGNLKRPILNSQLQSRIRSKKQYELFLDELQML